MPEYYERNYYHTYSNVSVSAKVGPWTDVEQTSRTSSVVRYRVVAMIETDVHSKTRTDRHRYTVVQVERRRDVTGSYSFYNSDILIGNFIDSEHEAGLFHSQNQSIHQGLWCSHCWADSEVNPRFEEGGIPLQPYFIDRYFSKVEALKPCWNCSRRFQPFLSSPQAPKKAFVFCSIRNKGLKSAVVQELLPHGVITFHVERPYDICVPEDMIMELVSCVFHPRRVEALVEAHGLDILEAL